MSTNEIIASHCEWDSRLQQIPETPQYWVSKSNGGYWDVMFGEERVMSCRAKSRSKAEMQNLLDHFNAKFEEKILERFFEKID